MRIESYDTRFSNHGRGKGIAVYGKRKESLRKISTDVIELSAVTTSNPLPTIQELCIVTLYLKKGFQLSLVKEELEEIFSKYENTIVVGDFNFDALQCTAPLYEWLWECGFNQLVKEPTHLEGGALDQAYVSPSILDIAKYHIHALYFSDHDAVCVTLRNLK